VIIALATGGCGKAAAPSGLGVPVASVTVTPAAASAQVGHTLQLIATPKDANGNVLAGRVVTWATSNAGVDTVSGSGMVYARAAGTATDTATSEGHSGMASITVTTTAPPPPGSWPNEPAGFTLINDWDMSQAPPQTPLDQPVPGSPGPWHLSGNKFAVGGRAGIDLISDPTAPD